jgi:hypothetical protein
MKSYFILHNSMSKSSRDFVNIYGHGNVIIDWYSATQQREEYLSMGYPSANNFPAVVDPDTKQISINPSTLDSAIQEFLITPSDKMKALFDMRVNSGFNTQKGYTLSLKKDDRDQFHSLLTLVREGLDNPSASFSPSSSVDIADINGTTITTTIQEFRDVIFQYGLYYKYIWDAYKSGDQSKLI